MHKHNVGHPPQNVSVIFHKTEIERGIFACSVSPMASPMDGGAGARVEMENRLWINKATRQLNGLHEISSRFLRFWRQFSRFDAELSGNVRRGADKRIIKSRIIDWFFKNGKTGCFSNADNSVGASLVRGRSEATTKISTSQKHAHKNRIVIQLTERLVRPQNRNFEAKTLRSMYCYSAANDEGSAMALSRTMPHSADVPNNRHCGDVIIQI